MTYTFHPDAEQEFLNAVEYYDGCESGLGLDFSAEVHAAIHNIIAFPQAWPILDGELRRCQTRRFPYGIIYSNVEDHEIYILAVMHLHRDPDYWRRRIM